MLQPVDWAGKPNNFSADLPFALGLEPFRRIFERCVDAGDEFVETVNNIIFGLFKFGLCFIFMSCEIYQLIE